MLVQNLHISIKKPPLTNRKAPQSELSIMSQIVFSSSWLNNPNKSIFLFDLVLVSFFILP